MWDDPFQEQDDDWNWMQELNPHSTLLRNAWNVGVGWAESEGFDLGVFGALSPSDDLVGNFFRANQWMNENPDADWMGDFPDLFSQMGNDFGRILSDAGSSISDLWQDVAGQAFGSTQGADELAPGLEGATGDLELGKAGALGAGTGGLVAIEAETLAATGADIAGAEILSGAAVAEAGLDLIALLLL